MSILILAEIAEERQRQDAQWGEQNHPDGTGAACSRFIANGARDETERAARTGTLTWRHILEEEVADDATRECWPGHAKILRRTGLTAESLKKTFQRLARRGLDPRVSLGTDRKGRTIFAYEGTQTTYRVPTFKRGDDVPPTEEAEGGPDSPLSNPTTGNDSEPRGGNVVPQRRESGPSEGGRRSPH